MRTKEEILGTVYHNNFNNISTFMPVLIEVLVDIRDKLDLIASVLEDKE